MPVRAVRGATHLSVDHADEMRDAVVELLGEMLTRNGLSTEDLVSVLFTATPDLVSAFPASAARSLDIADVPLICAQEIDVAGAMERVVRVLAHVETPLARREVTHVFLRGTHVLRSDLTT
jgi:chorismate mutase